MSVKTLSSWYFREAAAGRMGNQSYNISGWTGSKSNNFSTEIVDCSYCGKDGIVLPLLPFELCWNEYIRSFLYFFGIVYTFLGIAIVSDIFMAAIEQITSKTRRAFVKFGHEGTIQYKVYDDKVWNDTVANLTLMALGSSAPEILLSCIEIIGNRFETGPLGAGTIVGSAAFNLLVITAVCIVSVPNGEVRKIKAVKVFIVTSLFSLFAYAWMIIALQLSSEGVVELWEAVLTLLFFPILVLIAWWADHNFCFRGKPPRRWSSLVDDDEKDRDSELCRGASPLYRDGIVDQEALVNLYSRWRAINPNLTEEETATLVARKLIDESTHSHLWYRSGVSRVLMGGPQLVPVINEKLKEVYHVLKSDTDSGSQTVSINRKDSDYKKAIVEFHGASIAVMENVGQFSVKLIRRGRLDNEVTVLVETFDGTANAITDYIPFSTIVTFAPNSTSIDIPVTIVDDNQWEPEEEFFIRATIIKDTQESVLGKIPIMEIIILDDDNPGSISFTERGKVVKQDCGTAELHLKRSNGCDGIVNVSYHTMDGTAQCPDDYTETKGKIEFKHGEAKMDISVPIVNLENSSKNSYFFVVLRDPEGGLHLGDIPKIKVTISNEEVSADAIEKMMLIAAENVETMQLGHASYAAQFNDALSVNGGNTDEASKLDYVMHVVSFPWKVLFACLPPVGYCGGWLCFLSSLGVIGILTAIVGDMSSAFGCLIGMSDTVTAITFVALGTSVPDLFASKAAVATEKYADNAIGNVTGSNSVNVFLGLGLPWTIATIYHRIKGTKFMVDPGDLTFSVLIYTVTAIIAIFILFVRRIAFKAELGGGTCGKWVACFILFFLWFVYIALSALKSYEIYEFI